MLGKISQEEHGHETLIRLALFGAFAKKRGFLSRDGTQILLMSSMQSMTRV